MTASSAPCTMTEALDGLLEKYGVRPVIGWRLLSAFEAVAGDDWLLAPATTIESDDPGRVGRDRAGGAVPTGQQPQLAKEVAGAQARHHALALRGLPNELDLSGLDYVELIAGLALVEDDLSGDESALIAPHCPNRRVLAR